ncbi:hypothetical protein [Georgenia sp. SUBG003]|uniref:hypothetical protein n=1 Tax=Georgenia sp. SUBG003 TaxID=1497974 RepID=UPI003AB33FBB
MSLVHGDCGPASSSSSATPSPSSTSTTWASRDAASDVGDFVASLQQQALRAPTTEAALPDPAALDAADALAARFLTTYAGAAGDRGGRGPGGPRRTSHVAVALMRKALRAYAREPLSALPRRYVGQGHRVLDQREGP